jgi:hypothetical protein
VLGIPETAKWAACLFEPAKDAKEILVSNDGCTLCICSMLESKQEEAVLRFLKVNLDVFVWKRPTCRASQGKSPNISSTLSQVPSRSSRSYVVSTTTSARPYGRRSRKSLWRVSLGRFTAPSGWPTPCW